MSYDFDLFVIGAGSGGVRAARLAGALGKRVGIAEGDRVGGTCVIRGCVPKKLMVYASDYANLFQEAAGFGWSIKDYSFDWSSFVAGRDAEVERLEGLYRQTLAKNHVVLFESHAQLRDAHSIYLMQHDKVVTAKYILLAPGARSIIPADLEGAHHAITSDGVFSLKKRPQSIVIIGGGYIGVEFANIFHNLGVKTTLVTRGPAILSSFDEELRSLLAESMIQRGISILYDAQPLHIRPQHSEENCTGMAPEASVGKKAKGKMGYAVGLSNGQQLYAEKVLLALGRAPNTEALGLEQAGVEIDAKGAVCVDAYQRTNKPHIFAVGDVTNKIQLTPVAIHEAMCVIATLFEKRPTQPDRRCVPTAVFSYPEVGTVGLSEQEAKKLYRKLEVYRTTFRPLKQSLGKSNERMFMKLLVEAESRKVIGAHLLGHEAGEMIQILAIAVKAGLTKEQFDATMAVHPTAAEELVTMYKPSFCYQDGEKIPA